MAVTIVEHPDASRVARNVRVPAHDGLTLACDLYLPPGAELDGSGGRFPCVLEHIPYRKDEVGEPNDDHWYGYLPKHGYVMARLDCRGTGASEGVSTDEYTPAEQRDGAAAVEWLAAQPWCSGKVNMIGISYGGFTSIQVAALAPPHLTSVIPIDFTDSRYTDDVHYVGGLLRMWCDPGFYDGFMTAFNALPSDPRVNDDDWARLWDEHLEQAEPWLLKWLRNQTDGPYWESGSVGIIADRIACPVFMIGGWWDAYPRCSLRLAQKLRVPWKMLIGPWDHAVPNTAVPGPQIDYLPLVVRWLDHWCKTPDPGFEQEPPVAVYMQRFDKPAVDLFVRSGEWRAETSWPPAGAGELALHLVAGGGLRREPGEDGVDELEYDARVGVTRGLVQGGQPLVQPVDQRADEARSLVYTTEPLSEDVVVLGCPTAFLSVSTTATVAAFVVVLAEVAPDGTSSMVCKGHLNATRRHSMHTPEAVVPGEVMELEIELQATGWVFSGGNRIRVSVANADFPDTWPTPQPALSSVYSGGSRSSRLVLPTAPAQGNAPPPVYDPSPADAAARLTRSRIWHVVDDLIDGSRTVLLDWSVPHGSRTQSVRLHVDPARPAEASVRSETVSRARFGALAVDARSRVTIQGSPTHLHVSIVRDVVQDGLEVSQRRWAESIPRNLL